MAGTLTPFQVRLRHRMDQGFQVVAIDEQAQRALLRVRVTRISPARPIVRTQGSSYTCRLIEVDSDGNLQDRMIPC